jgi:hypothetical protein
MTASVNGRPVVLDARGNMTDPSTGASAGALPAGAHFHGPASGDDLADGLVPTAAAAPPPDLADGLVPTPTKTTEEKPSSTLGSIRDALSSAFDLAYGTASEAQVGAAKRVAEQLSHVINMVHDSYGGDLVDIPEYQRTHPGATATQAWDAIRGVGPDGKAVAPWMPQKALDARQHLSDASTWLASKAKMPGITESTPLSPIGGAAQHAGGLGTDLAQYFGLEGLLKLAATPEEAAGAARTAMSTAAQLKKAGTVGDVLERYPVLARMAALGTRVAHSVAEGGPVAEQGIIGGTQAGIESEGNPRSIAMGAALGAGTAAAANEAAAGAASYLNRSRASSSAAAAEAAAAGEPLPPPVEHPLPERPTPAEFTPAPRPEAPTPPEMPPDLPPPPERPAPIAPSPLPARPEAPTPLEPSPPIEPTPVPEPPTPPEPYVPDRAPAEERFRQLEQQVAQGVGNNAVAATHLENLNSLIRDNRVWRQSLTDSQWADISKMRDELLDHVMSGTAPADSGEVVSAIGDMGQAAEALRAGPTEARARWNDMTGGSYETINNEIEKLAGKVDSASVVKRMDLTNQLNQLLAGAKFGDTATPAIRAAHEALLSKADILDGADDAFTKAFTGAGRTGEMNFNTLQTNWKNFVNKNGVPAVRNALGAERYNTMNDFINDVVKEPAADRAAQAALDTAHEGALSQWKQQVSSARTLDKARQATQDAMDSAAQGELDSMHQEEMKTWQRQVMDAKSLDAAKKAAQDAEFAETRRAFQQAKTQRAQLISERTAQMKQMQDEFAGKMTESKNLDATQKAKIASDHAANMKQFKAETDRLTAINQANIGEYKQQARMRAAQSAGGKQQTAVSTANLVKVIMADDLYRMLPLPIRAKAGIVAGAGYAIKRIVSNPATARVFMNAVRTGGDPHAYAAVIAGMLHAGMAQQPPGETNATSE